MPMPATMPEIKPGDVIAGRFRVVELVGRGGFSVVYRAYQQRMNRFVALKFLKPGISDDEKIVERFRREALFASHLSHPNTITLFDYGANDHGLFYIAMEYLEGRDLSELVREEGRLALPKVWSTLVQCCQSLAEAHKLSLIHRDLKPENIFLVDDDPHEQVKVLDFGLSKALRSLTGGESGVMTPLTQDGKVFGTPLYMAPEQAMDNPITPAIDVHALGHITWEMIVGEPKYADLSNPMDIMLRQIYDAPLELPEPWDDTPFADLIHACTRKAPEDRLPTAGAVLERLRSPSFQQYRDGREAPTLAATPNPPSEAPTDPQPDREAIDNYVDQLTEIFEGVDSSGHMQLTLLTGPGGGGRTRVLRQFLESLDDTDATIVHRTEDNREVTSATAGLRSDLGTLEGDEADDAPGLFELLDLEAPFSDRWLDGSGQRESAVFGHLADRRSDLLARCAELFRGHADDRPLIWALESLEEVDAFSLAFLNWFFQDLQSDPAPVMIVATLDRQGMMRRTGMLRYTQAILGASAPHAHQIAIRPAFDPSSIERLLETGEVAGNADASDSDPADELGDQVSNVEYPEDGREAFDQLLAFLAQFGDEIPAPLFDRIIGWRDDLPASRVDRILEWGERFGIVHRQDGSLRFTKHTFGDTLRERWRELHPDRPDFHLRIARTLVDFYDPLPRQLVDLVVEHYLAAGRPTRAAELLFETADRAYRALNLDAAREHLMRLQRLIHPDAADDPRDLDIDPVYVWIRLGEIHGALEEHGAARDALHQAADQAGDDQPQARARALKLLGDLQSARDQNRRAADFYRDARQHFREADDEVAEAAVSILLGSAQLRDGRPDAAVETLSATRLSIRDAGRPALMARASHRLGEALNHMAEFDRAEEALRDAFQAFESLDYADESNECLRALGEALMGGGRHERAQEAFAAAQKGTSSRRPTKRTEAARFGQVRALAALRRFDEAAEQLDTAIAEADQTFDRNYHATLHLYRGDVYLAVSDWDRALDQYEQLRRRSRDVGHTELYTEALIRKAFAHFDSGASDDAWDGFERAMTFVEEFGTRADLIDIRARALYLQSIDCDFAFGASGLKGLFEQASSEIGADSARLTAQLALADAAADDGEHARAKRRLDSLRMEAARLDKLGLLLPVHRRMARLESDADPEPWEGVALGTLFPPEVDCRRHPYDT